MEYQYYEFRAIDRPLTSTDKEYIETLSSRVKPTNRKAIFTYSYGDFRGDPLLVLNRCFDAMLYTANWGSHQLAFRYPKSALNLAALQPYLAEGAVEVVTHANTVILNLAVQYEGVSYWIDEDNTWLTQLIPLRQAILNGDYRVLYLTWLAAVEESMTFEGSQEEPPVPPNLKTLDEPLQTFCDWLQLDPDLIAVAAQNSPTHTRPSLSYKKWVKALSEAEKTELLVEMVTGDSDIALQLQSRLQQRFKPTLEQDTATGEPRRSLTELREQADENQAKQQSAEKAKQRAERRDYLLSLKPKKHQLWETVDTLIAQKQTKPYEQAIKHLLDLQGLARLENEEASFQNRVNRIQTNYSSCWGLLSRLRDANLISKKE
jgi:hypothetical protein